MKLDQFDKMKELIDQISIRFQQLKFNKNNLERENIELKKQLEKFTNSDYDQILLEKKKLEEQNQKLKEKQEQIALKVEKLIQNIES
jgi:hypothetical protein